MSGKEALSLINRIENEGFDYCFIHYSEFLEIKDEEFHKLREQYIKARNQLANYVGYES